MEELNFSFEYNPEGEDVELSWENIERMMNALPPLPPPSPTVTFFIASGPGVDEATLLSISGVNKVSPFTLEGANGWHVECVPTDELNAYLFDEDEPKQHAKTDWKEQGF